MKQYAPNMITADFQTRISPLPRDRGCGADRSSRSITSSIRCSHSVRLPLAICLFLMCGCTTFDLNKRIPWMDSDKPTQPAKITALWTQTILNQSGHKGVRGFGGRIMFHGKENEKPVKVEGTLIVYAFDETKQVSSVPERKFVFTPEQFEKHYSQSKLGHSYSIWLPWDEVGGPPRRINLLARFEPVSGSMVMSDNSLQILPGIESAPYDDAEVPSQPKELPAEVQQAGFQTFSTKTIGAEPAVRPATAEGDTINVPPSFIRRLGPDDPLPAWRPSGAKNSSTSSPALKPDSQSSAENPEAASTSMSIPPKGSRIDTNQAQATTSQKALAERQRELADHFGRRKFQVQRASVARSTPVPPLNRLPPADELSLLPQSSSPGSTDRVPSKTSSDSADSR